MMYFLQIATGGLADRIGRRPPVIAGMFITSVGDLGMVLVEGYPAWAILAGVSSLGMALLYPDLMTVPSDACPPTWRVTGIGVYWMWRDAGYGVGAILIGLSMEFVNAEVAFYMTTPLMFVPGVVVCLWMEETHPDFETNEPPAPAPEQPRAVLQASSTLFIVADCLRCSRDLNTDEFGSDSASNMMNIGSLQPKPLPEFQPLM